MPAVVLAVVPAVAEPPLWQYLLFEQPWPLVIALVAAAVALSVLARRQDSRTLRTLAWAAALGAGAVYALAWQVTTGREQLIARSEALIAATESPMDVPALADQWLSTDAVLIGPDGTLWLDRDQIESRLAAADQRYGIEQQSVRGVEAETTRPGYGRTLIDLSTELGGGRSFGPVRTEWDVTWIKDEADEWRVQEIRWIRIRDQSPTRRLLP